MTDCCMETQGTGRMRTLFPPTGTSYAEMISRGAHTVVGWAERVYRRWNEHRKMMKALDCLCRLDDQHLADIGLSRDDLTVEGLATAAAKRNQAHATMGHRA